MNDSRKLYHVFTLSVIGAATLLPVLRTAALLLAFDRGVGYHGKGVFPTLLYIAAALFLAGVVAYVFTAKRISREHRLALSPDAAVSPLSVCLSSVLTALAFAAAGLWESFRAESFDNVALLRVIGAALAIVYFALPRKSKAPLLSIGAHVYFFFVLVSEYFDWSVPMNSPIKLMQQIAAVCAMLALCAETLELAGKNRPLRFTVCASLAAVFGLSNGISLIFTLFTSGIARTDQVVHALPVLAVGAYFLTRLLHPREVSLPAPPEKAEEPSASKTAKGNEEGDHPNATADGESAEIRKDLPTTNQEEN